MVISVESVLNFYHANIYSCQLEELMQFLENHLRKMWKNMGMSDSRNMRFAHIQIKMYQKTATETFFQLSVKGEL